MTRGESSLWLGRKNLFQTFETQDELTTRQDIKEIRALLDEENDEEKPQC
jgi:hypothetical protein